MSYCDRDHITLQKYKNMYKSSVCTDFRVSVKGKVFEVHKFVLCAQNSFFRDMLSARPQRNDFQTTEVDTAAFEVFLKFLYTGRVDTIAITGELLRIAHNFSANELKEVCVEVLLTRIDKFYCG